MSTRFSESICIVNSFRLLQTMCCVRAVAEFNLMGEEWYRRATGCEDPERKMGGFYRSAGTHGCQGEFSVRVTNVLVLPSLYFSEQSGKSDGTGRTAPNGQIKPEEPAKSMPIVHLQRTLQVLQSTLTELEISTLLL